MTFELHRSAKPPIAVILTLVGSVGILGFFQADPVAVIGALLTALSPLVTRRLLRRPAPWWDTVLWATPGAVAGMVLRGPIVEAALFGPYDSVQRAVGEGMMLGMGVGAFVAACVMGLRLWSRSATYWAGASVSILVTLTLFAVPAGICPGRTKAYRAAMKSDLRNLAAAQEAFQADSNRVASSVEALAAGVGYFTSAGVAVNVVAKGEGYLAVAFHEMSPSVCMMWVGTGVPMPGGDEGQPHCVQAKER